MRSSFEFARKMLPKDTPIVGAEIGVDKGENAKDILTNWKEVRTLHLIDDYAIYPERKQEALENLKEFKDRIVWHYGKSLQLADKFPPFAFNFIYLDSDHYYSEVMKDIMNWIHKVSGGGVLCGHDCSIFEIGVLETIMQLRRLGWSIYADMDYFLPSETSKRNLSDWWMQISWAEKKKDEVRKV